MFHAGYIDRPRVQITKHKNNAMIYALGNNKYTPTPAKTNPRILAGDRGMGLTPPIPIESMTVDKINWPNMTLANPAAIPARCSEKEMPVTIKTPSTPEMAVIPRTSGGTFQAWGPSLSNHTNIIVPATIPPIVLVRIPVRISPIKLPTRLIRVDCVAIAIPVNNATSAPVTIDNFKDPRNMIVMY